MARTQLFGIAVAPGIAIGKIIRTHQETEIVESFVKPDEIEKEVEKLRIATKAVSDDLLASKNHFQEKSKEHFAIMQTHLMLSNDPRILENAEEFVRSQRMCAPWAMQKTIDTLCAAFLNIDDPYLQERALDLKAVGLRLQNRLAGKEFTPLTDHSPCIHMAEDLSPVDTLDLPVEQILALVMAEGGPTSHTAVLARSLHIPAMVGVTGILEIAKEGDFVIVDALGGCVYIDPSDEEIEHFHQKKIEYLAWEENIQYNAHLLAETQDAIRIEVQANVKNSAEVEKMIQHGGEGIGLYRTEFAYMSGRKLPTEEQLFAEYSSIAKKIAPQRVIFRILDVGADKSLGSHTSLKEANPALGLRGIRFCLRHQEILRVQLRALLRASLHGNIGIMIPMITCLEEVLAVKQILREVVQNLSAQGIEHSQKVPLGVMIEVPAAVVIADALAKQCDFLSIGTNDLVHYLLAIDRGNRHVSYLHQPLHPAVTQSIKRVVDSAHREGIGVSVCGEMVTDPYCLAVLLGMGVDSVSTTAQYIPAIKHFIRHLHMGKCQHMVQNMLTTHDTTSCMRKVTKALTQSLRNDLSFYTTFLPKHG